MRPWPPIPYEDWAETCAALHLFSQIVGKYRLAHTPWVNHSWHATLYVTPTGLTTGPVPDGDRMIELVFDFQSHQLAAIADDGAAERFPLEAMSVAGFFDRTTSAIAAVGGSPAIHGRPNELPDAIPFADDTKEREYHGDAVLRFHRALTDSDRVFRTFRTGFLGKVSPVHLFWGSFDLAITRFSGRTAPTHPGGFPNLPDAVTREAYSHEVASAGFWPGGGGVDEAMYYAYAYPTPDDMKECEVKPSAARFDEDLGEFLLPYEAVRTAEDPDAALLAFLQSTYEAAAKSADWPRHDLEAPIGRPRVPRSV